MNKVESEQKIKKILQNFHCSFCPFSNEPKCGQNTSQSEAKKIVRKAKEQGKKMKKVRFSAKNCGMKKDKCSELKKKSLTK